MFGEGSCYGAALLLVACGDGGGPPPSEPPSLTPPAPTTLAVHLNQTGFHPDAGKIAIVVSDALPWRLVDAGGTEKASGTTSRFGLNTGSGDIVHHVDFTTATEAGDGLRIEVDDVLSEAFSIGADVYTQLKFDALNFFYQQRSAHPIEMPYAGGTEYTRPAGHPTDVAICWRRRSMPIAKPRPVTGTTSPPSRSTKLQSTGMRRFSGIAAFLDER